MSTKTNFKRVALVAAAALGLGVLSSVPSQAVVIPTTLTLTATNSTTTTTVLSDSTTAATLGVSFLGTANPTPSSGSASAGDSVSITITNKSIPGGESSAPTVFFQLTDTATSGSNVRVKVSGGGYRNGDGASFKEYVGGGISGGDGKLGNIDTGTSAILSTGVGNTYAAANFKLYMNDSTPSAGTYVYTVTVSPFDSGTINTANIKTVDVSFIVAAPATAAAAGQSTAYLSTGSSFVTGTTSDSTVVVAATASTTARAVAQVKLRDADGVGTNIAESVTVTTNLGSVSCGTGGPVGKNLTCLYTAGASSTLDIGIYSDGNAGEATINISSASVTFAAKKVTFYSTTSTKIVAVKGLNTLSVGSNGSSSNGAVWGKATDANGNTVAANALGASGVYAYSSNTAVVSDSGTACTYSAATGYHMCALTGVAAGTAKITLRNSATAGAASTVNSAETVEVTVSTAAPATLKMEWDKKTYAPGEKAVLKIWAADSAGKPVGQQTLANLISAAGITRTGAFTGTEPTWTATSYVLSHKVAALGDALDSVEPIATLTAFMPYAGGAISVSATGGSSLALAGQVAVTATATVTDSGAAALAAVNALATTVASLRTLITTLTNLVLKIQKKVKA
jgi:hypothetical protein